jgi:hypothetical protein
MAAFPGGLLFWRARLAWPDSCSSEEGAFLDLGVSMSEIWRVVRYRNCAETLRFIADQTDHDGHKEALHRAAEHFDFLAALAERRERQRAEIGCVR